MKLLLIMLFAIFIVPSSFAGFLGWGVPTCEHVTIKIKNNIEFPTESGKMKKNRKLRVKKLQFYDDAADKWRSEQVKNTTITGGAIGTFKESLGDVRGMKVTKFKIRYDYELEDGKWGKDLWSDPIVPTSNQSDLVCKNNKTIYTIDFTNSKFNKK